jgi:sulfite oxidase
MNGQPLKPRHGFPVRVVVPGVLGARSVKWLDQITVSASESPSFYQVHDYKVLPESVPDMDTAEAFWASTPAMLEMPINSAVAFPRSDSTVTLSSGGVVEVSGYSVAQGSSGPVIRVQVSGDEGKTWVDAHLNDGGEYASRWSWVLFSVRIKMSAGKNKKIFAKATDQAGNTQEQARSAWNIRGVAYNGFEAVVDLTVVEASRL